MNTTRHAVAPVQAESLTILDIVPGVLFVAVSVGRKRVLLRHPSGCTLSVPAWRVRPLVGSG